MVDPIDGPDGPDGPEDGDDDFVLLAAWCRGDRQAGDRLIRRHYPHAARFFRSKAPETAQLDLIQETFERALRSAPRFRREARFKTYLLGIARNVLVDHLRKWNRWLKRLGPEVDLEETPAAFWGPSAVADMLEHEEQRLMLEALRNIPLIHQIVIELHYWEGLTTEEISAALRIPLGTARTRLRDGRMHLEKQLRLLARSPQVLRSTLDSLRRWTLRMREKAGLEQAAGPDEPGSVEQT